MASGSSLTQPPPAKRRKESSPSPIPTTIHSLGEDLLLAVFLRLTSLATLIRAAFTCRAWRRAVASSPAFRRRFRELHPALLLGLFFEPSGGVQDPDLPAFPSFVPARHRDRDLAAAVRGGDFFLTSIQEHPDKAHCWDLFDCRGGYALLYNGDKKNEESMALLNPLARRSQRFFDGGHWNTFEGYRGYAVQRKSCLLYSDEDPTSFKVVRLAHDESRVRATVFSSDTGEWSILPWVDVPARPRRSKSWLLNSSMQANGFLYWVYQNHKYMVSLDTSTMEFSVEELPRFLKNQPCSFVVGEASRGVRCIVYAIDLTVGVLLRRTDNDGVERWILDKATPLDAQFRGILGKLMVGYNELLVVAVRDGYAYLATSKKFNDAQMPPSWFFSLCLDTMKLEKLFQRTYDAGVHPYVMAWPSSLVGNFGRFALEDGA